MINILHGEARANEQRRRSAIVEVDLKQEIGKVWSKLLKPRA